MPVLAALVGLTALVAYLLCAGPTFHWLDSGELVAAGVTLGVSHPPGHALHGLVARLFCLLPVGSLAFRVTLASAVQAGAATALTAVLSHQVSRRAGAPRWISAAASAGAALVLGLSYALWLQAVRAEVYALNLLLLVAGVVLVLRWDRDGDRRFLLLAALVAGLALGNHHFLVLLALPAVLLFLVLRGVGARWRRVALGLVLCGGLGLTVLAYLPLRASRAPLVDWGHPTTVERFGRVVAAQAFHKTVDRAAAESLEHRGLGGLFTVVRGVAWDSLLGIGVGLAALLGLYLLLRRRDTRHVGLLLALLVACNLLSPILVGLDPYNPDAYGYLCVAVAFLCPGLAVVGALGLAAAWRGTGRRRWVVPSAGVLALALLAWQVRTNLPRTDLRDSWAAEETARQQSAGAPPGAVLLTSYFGSVFNLWALQATTDLRPDLQLVHRHFVDQPGYVEQLERRGHPLAGRVRRWRAAGLHAADLKGSPPVFLEYDTDLRPGIVNGLQPAGLLQRFGKASASDLARHLQRMQRWEGLLGRVGVDAGDNETRRAAVWTHYQLAHYACRRGVPAMVQYHLGRARRLAPNDVLLGRLEKRCRGKAQWPGRGGL